MEIFIQIQYIFKPNQLIKASVHSKILLHNTGFSIKGSPHIGPPPNPLINWWSHPSICRYVNFKTYIGINGM